MADEPTLIVDADRQTVPILTDEVTERNGLPNVDQNRAQVIKIARGSDGVVNDITPSSPLEIGDFSPPLVQLSSGGVAVMANQIVELIPVNFARVLVDVMCDQDDAAAVLQRARVWLASGDADPAVGVGNFIRPDGCFSQWTSDRVAVLADADCVLTWVEWGT